MPKSGWTSLAALILLPVFASALDGLMDALGPAGLAAVSAVVMGVARRLIGVVITWDGK